MHIEYLLEKPKNFDTEAEIYEKSGMNVQWIKILRYRNQWPSQRRIFGDTSSYFFVT